MEMLQGKLKMCQEVSKGDREGVGKGVEGFGSDAGKDLARSVMERGALKDRED